MDTVRVAVASAKVLHREWRGERPRTRIFSNSLPTHSVATLASTDFPSVAGPVIVPCHNHRFVTFCATAETVMPPVKLKSVVGAHVAAAAVPTREKVPVAQLSPSVISPRAARPLP